MAEKKKSSTSPDKIINRVLVEAYGLRPYDPAVHAAQDVGLGGPSTEYLATDYDPYGAAINYPTIWWDMYGNPVLMEQAQAYDQAMAYEATTGRSFPRYMTIGQAEVGAEHRSARGGGDSGPLATLLGNVNW